MVKCTITLNIAIGDFIPWKSLDGGAIADIDQYFNLFSTKSHHFADISKMWGKTLNYALRANYTFSYETKTLWSSVNRADKIV